MPRRAVLMLALLLPSCAAPTTRAAVPSAGAPAIVRHYVKDHPWLAEVRWDRAVRLEAMPGDTAEARLAAAQERLGDAGGVVQLPAGRLTLARGIALGSGVVLCGAEPTGPTGAREDGVAPPTRLVLPAYGAKVTGEGSDPKAAFMGITLADPAGAENVGVVNVALDHGHIHFADTDGHRAGRNRFVLGCLLTNAARLDPRVPDADLGQHAWQRFPSRSLAAIHVYSGENALVARCRVAKSDANFPMPGYVLRDRRGGTVRQTVVFDYDNRPGIKVNAYPLGGRGGRDPKGTPETLPHGFRKGSAIRDCYVWSTGRTCIHFSGDGTLVDGNVIRMAEDVHRHTHTGRGLAGGGSTNSNRAMILSGWRYTVSRNDYRVYRNRVGDSPYFINDGEGLMHEGHANCIVKDAKIVGNTGNAYLSIYKTAGIDGLLVKGNDIRPRGTGTDTRIAALYLNSDRNWDRHLCRNVRVLDNTVSGDILVAGTPAEGNVVRGNRYVGEGRGTVINAANAVVEDNTGFDEAARESDDRPVADPDRPGATVNPETWQYK